MKDCQRQFLSLLGRAPARLTTEQAAWFLNCEMHDIPVLVAERLLKPLGNPPPNGHKYFAAAELLELGSDRDWLAKATHTLQQFWQRKNGRRTKLQPARNLNGSLVIQGHTMPAVSPNGHRPAYR